MALCLTSAAPAVTPDHTVRVMRWTFRRDDESLVCRLGLNRDDSAYELRIDPPSNPIGTSLELFDDAVSAFQRHASIERHLIEDGWSLDAFESIHAARSGSLG